MTGQIVVTEQNNQVAATTTADTNIMAVISRVATDPNCDIDKMERLLQMHERMRAKDAEQAFNAAMAQMQCELPTVFEGAVNLHTRNSYATLDDITRTIKPVMKRHGFAITFKVDNAEKAVDVTGILMHSGGHREQTTLRLPIDEGAGRNKVQAVGSSTTYGKRYVMCALLNITTGDAQDDDGQTADGSASAEERAQVVDSILDQVSHATTSDELKDVWQAAVKTLRDAGDVGGYDKVKIAVTQKKAKLESQQ